MTAADVLAELGGESSMTVLDLVKTFDKRQDVAGGGAHPPAAADEAHHGCSCVLADRSIEP